MAAGTPSEVTFAPRVAPVVVMADEVGVVTVGTALEVVVNCTSLPYAVPTPLVA